jgi:hypothetical protein
MKGGSENPLGARAMYLGTSLYLLEPRKEGYLIVACTVITDVPEAVGP